MEKGVEKYYAGNIMNQTHFKGETERTHDHKENR